MTTLGRGRGVRVRGPGGVRRQEWPREAGTSRSRVATPRLADPARGNPRAGRPHRRRSWRPVQLPSQIPAVLRQVKADSEIDVPHDLGRCLRVIERPFDEFANCAKGGCWMGELLEVRNVRQPGLLAENVARVPDDVRDDITGEPTSTRRWARPSVGRRPFDELRERVGASTVPVGTLLHQQPRLGVRAAAQVGAEPITGEIELRGDDFAGIGVHIAARVVEAAEGGELLVSGRFPCSPPDQASSSTTGANTNSKASPAPGSSSQ
jgi:hypothetical protein